MNILRWARQEGRWLMHSARHLMAELYKPFEKPMLIVYCDPRTGKPWKSMKQAREWFDIAISSI